MRIYLYETEKWMILGAILTLLGIALMVPGLGTIGLYWPGKVVLMRNMILEIIGAVVAIFGAVYCFLMKGVQGV